MRARHLDAWVAMAARASGSYDEARGRVDSALEAAADCDADRTLADVHMAAATVAHDDESRNERDHHAAVALAACERAGDVHRLARVRVGIALDRIDEGHYRSAIELLDVVLASAAAGSPTYWRWALLNRGLGHWCLGELDEAQADTEVIASLESSEPTRALGVIGLADIHRTRGHAELARSRYADGLAFAEEDGNQTAILIALCGLARTLVDANPAEAERLVQRAREVASIEQAWALNARAWIALSRGNASEAVQAAEEALEIARRRGFAYEMEKRSRSALSPRATPPRRVRCSRRHVRSGRRSATESTSLSSSSRSPATNRGPTIGVPPYGRSESYGRSACERA